MESFQKFHLLINGDRIKRIPILVYLTNLNGLKTIVNLFALICLPFFCLAQITIKDTARLPFFKDAVQASFKQAPQFAGSKLDSIGKALRNGNKTALLAIAPYLDDTSQVTRFLGYHILKPRQKDVARDLITENVSFLQSEIKLNTKTSTSDWLKFTDANFDKIAFDTDAGVFVLTPITERMVPYEIRELSPTRKEELKRSAEKLLNLPWLRGNNTDLIIGNKDPYALYKIAAEFYRTKNRFNIYQFNEAEYIDLLQLLTGTDIGVEDESHKITHHIDKDFQPDSRLNLLIYFARNYSGYHWDENVGVFVNPALTPVALDKETTYFQQLSSETNSIAMKAFIALTVCDTAKVRVLADGYRKADLGHNDTVPLFPYPFLKQLTMLTTYCKAHKIDFEGSEKLRRDITLLTKDLSFRDRRSLENELINTLSLDDITAFEYWCIINEEQDNLTHSAGRILDIFYSRNWKLLKGNTKHLALYLKKSMLYTNLQIIGTCNNYLEKFIKADALTINALQKLKSNDSDIKLQRTQAIKVATGRKAKPKDLKKFDDSNYDAVVINLDKDFNHFIKTIGDSDVRNDSLSSLFSRINFKQIGRALVLLENYKAMDDYDTYSFMANDFGFFEGDFSEQKMRREFLNYYAHHTELEIYAHYLKKAGINYMRRDNALDYDKIYDLLKYDVVTAFVGGGNGKKQNETYAIIKLLELKFKTTLGYPKKLCNSDMIYACDPSYRAKDWMLWLKQKRLLKLPHNEPYSFSYFDN
jgi:hypothetical protein